MKKTLLSLSMSALMSFAFTTSVKAADYTLELHKGETFCLVSATEMPNADEKISQRYFKEAFAMATRYGMANRGGTEVIKTIGSNYPAEFWSFFTFPSPQAKRDFSSEKSWPALRELRTQAWDNLRILDLDVQQDMKIEMDNDKVYVMSWVWTKPDRFDNFVSIKDAVLELEEKHGARVVAQFDAQSNNPAYYTLGMEQTPDFVMMTEWSSVESYEKFSASEVFAKTVAGTQSIIAGHESTILKLPKKKMGG